MRGRRRRAAPGFTPGLRGPRRAREGKDVRPEVGERRRRAQPRGRALVPGPAARRHLRDDARLRERVDVAEARLPRRRPREHDRVVRVGRDVVEDHVFEPGRHVLAHLEAQHGVEDGDRPVERPADVERPNGRPGARAVVVRRRREALYFVEVRTVPAAAGAEVANRRRPRPAAARHEVLRERRCQAPVQAGIPGLGAEACVRRTRSRHCLRSLTRRVTLMRHRADAVAATASVRAASRHCSDGALSDTPRRPRRGPKRLKIER